MSYNPLIAAAKREAKRRAQSFGSSYQHELNQLAKLAGKESWPAYVQSPEPISFAEKENQSSETQSPQNSSRAYKKIIVLGLLLLISGLGIVRFVANYDRQMKSLEELYYVEKGAASKLNGLTFVEYNGFTHVTAQKISETKREAHFLLRDYRTHRASIPVQIYGQVMNALNLEKHDLKYAHLPHVMRIDVTVNCTTGEITNISAVAARDLVSKPMYSPGKVPQGNPQYISKEESDVICGDEILDKTKNVADIVSLQRSKEREYDAHNLMGLR